MQHSDARARVGGSWGVWASSGRCLTFGAKSCSCEQIRPNRLQNALTALGDAMREVNAAIEEMRREHDPLASHIFVSRRLYQKKSDTKSGKRHHLSARLSWQQACDLGFRGDLGEWERLMGATPKRWKSRLAKRGFVSSA